MLVSYDYFLVNLLYVITGSGGRDGGGGGGRGGSYGLLIIFY